MSSLMRTPRPVRVPIAEDSVSDYSRALGAAALGARLRRLSERIDREAALVYARAGVRFEQRWMGPLSLLADREAMSVGDLASALVISHPSVSQARRSLEAAGLITEKADPDDRRRRLLHLTAAGVALVGQLRPFWVAFARAAEELNVEVEDIIGPLNRLEDALTRQSLHQRVAEILPARS